MNPRPYLVSVFLLGLTLLLAQTSFGQSSQPPAQVYNEARTVYLSNLARQQNGVPPLRWNGQLTEAARWFSWDSVENRSEPYCGHQDTQGHWPDWRAKAYGYQGAAGAENAFCGFLTPEQAVEGWMNSPGHRANLLDPNSREVGLGYYLRDGDNRGYVTQDFGHDPVYPPVIIENEAINTTSPFVDLFIYDRESGGGFAGRGPAVQMMISEDPCFSDATWEPYLADRSWTLEPGEGWRQVYVKSRDVFSRTVVVSDAIYLGPHVPLDELGQTQMSTTEDQVTLYNLDGGGLSSVQFSLGWLADDTFDRFSLNWGSGEQVTDSQAWGGTAFRLLPGEGESFAWVWTTNFIKDTPLVAYFRLRVNDNASADEVARISVQGGGTEYGPVQLAGIDFADPDHYQEFPLAFTFHANESDPFLIFKFWRSGSAEVYVDAVSIFTAPEPATSPLTWTVPGGNYRGQGLWLRYTNGNDQFSPMSEADRTPVGLEVSPSTLIFLAERDGELPSPRVLNVGPTGCRSLAWQVDSEAAWLQLQTGADFIQVSVDHDGMDVGTYSDSLIVEASASESVTPVTVAITLIVLDDLYQAYLPHVRRK
jgi:uncharacterized protein YkwD